MVQDLQPVDGRGLRARDGRHGGVACFRDTLGRHSRVDLGLFLITVLADVGLALAEGLRVADDHPDILRPGAGHREQVVDDRQGIDAVDVQDPVEHQVH